MMAHDPMQEAIDRAIAAQARAFAEASAAVEAAKECVRMALIELLAVKPIDPTHLLWRECHRAMGRLDAARASLDELHRQRILAGMGADE